MPGFTPLVVAAHGGREADVAQLLADGAEVNERAGGSSESGASDWTALMVACAQGHTDVVTTL